MIQYGEPIQVEGQTQSLEKHFQDPTFIPTHEQIAAFFSGDEDESHKKWAEYWDGKKEYELLNQEFITAFGNYLIQRAEELGGTPQNPVVILEAGAGRGRLTYFLDKYLKSQKAQNITLIASDSGEWEITPLFKIEPLDLTQSLEKYQPQIVIFSWIPPLIDLTAEIRKAPSVQEYLLVGRPNSFTSGRPWETWGVEAARPKGTTDMPAYQKDGFQKQEIPEVSIQQMSLEDSPGNYGRSKTVSFRKVE